MISLTPVAGTPLAALGEAVPCLCPDTDIFPLAGPLDDLPEYHPAYYAEPLPLPARINRRPAALGRISWPCWGLTRFACGHVLLSAESLAAVESLAGYDGRVWVTLDDGVAAEPVVLTMRVINRRPLVDPRAALDAAVDSTAPMAWVLTLTDDRWDRAGKIYATASTGTPSTWGALLNEVLTAAGYTFAAADINATLALYSPAYDVPSATWFARSAMNGRPAVVLADAIAAACGLRIAVGADGEIDVQGPDAAGEAWTDWVDAYGESAESGGLIDNAGTTRPLTLNIYPAGGTAAIIRTITDGVRGTVDVSAQPSISSNCADRIAADLSRWMDAGGAEIEAVGYPPVPASAVPAEVGWETAVGKSWVSDGPAWWPWPLVGYVPAMWTPVTKDIQTNTCPVFNTYGAITGIRVEYTPVTWGPTGVTFGTPYCVTNPTGCCPVAITCEGCPEPITLPANACLRLRNKTGAAACLPDSIPLDTLPAITPAYLPGFLPTARNTSASADDSSLAGWFTFCVGGGFGGTDCTAALQVTVVCDPTGFTVDYYALAVGLSFPTPLDGFSASAVQPCDAFGSASGEIFLGTITNTTPSSASVDVYLAWGANCDLDTAPAIAGCPPNCSLGVGYHWDDGLGGGGSSGSSGFALHLDVYDPGTGTTTWTAAVNTRCGLLTWTATCDGSGDLSLVAVDPLDPGTPLFEATFTEVSPGVWTGTIVTACGDITAVTIQPVCGYATPGGEAITP